MTGGYGYGQHPPTEKCPYCGARCDADFVDIGVGMQQCGPFHCENCGASEIGPHDKERVLTNEESKTGWYAPGKPPGSSANVIGGRIVSHVVMRDTYRDKFLGEPLYDVPGEVEKWWKDIRK